MSGVMHKVKEAVTSHGHHDKHHETTETGNDYQISNGGQTNNAQSGNIANASESREQNPSPGNTGGYHKGSVDSHQVPPTGNDLYRDQNRQSHSFSPTASGAAAPDSTNSAIHSSISSSDSASTGDHRIGPAPSTAGPHSSDTMNKADPRVNSDRDGDKNDKGGKFLKDVNRSSLAGDAGTIPVTGSGGQTSTKTFEPHASAGGAQRSSNQSTGGGSSYNTPGKGSAQNTAGPHDSNVANKLDPRVDSDRDGSRTVGSQSY